MLNLLQYNPSFLKNINDLSFSLDCFDDNLLLVSYGNKTSLFDTKDILNIPKEPKNISPIQTFESYNTIISSKFSKNGMFIVTNDFDNNLNVYKREDITPEPNKIQILYKPYETFKSDCDCKKYFI